MTLLCDVCANILTYEKIGKVRDFNARVGTYEHLEVDDKVVVLDQTLHDLELTF